MSIDLKKISMKKLSIIVSFAAFSILVVALIIILNFARTAGSTPVNEEELSVGLILNGDKNDRSWNSTHYDALMHISDELRLNVITAENTPGDESCLDVINDLIQQDCRIIIGGSYEFGEYMEKAAEENPDRYFLHASGTAYGSNIGSFFGRMYQLRYLSGIAAGCQTETGHIAYVAAFPIPEVIRGINAFTLGVRSVNPDAVVHVAFCDSWNEDEAASQCAEKLITQYGTDVLTLHTNSLAPLRVAEEKGVWSIGYNSDTSDLFPETFITACEWCWDEYYREQIILCRQGKFKGEHTWLGIESGIMRLTPFENSGNADSGSSSLIEDAMKRFEDRSFDVFYGPVTDNSGNVRIADGESVSDEYMLERFDWYVEGVLTDD